MSSARRTQALTAGSRTPESQMSKNAGPPVRSVRRAALALLTAALAVGAPLLAVQPANAVPGLVTSQRISLNNSSAEKVVSAPCPSGTRAIGGSAVVGGSTRVRVNSQVPDAAGYTVLAREPRGGVPESWEVVVTAHCAPSSALPGLEYRRSGSVFDSATSHGATAACSPGKRLIGVGGVIDSQGPGQDRLVLTAIRPATDLTSIRVDGREDEAGYTGGWRATAVGVCVTPVSGQLLATGTSTVDSVGTKRAIATCPPGSKIHSGGFDVGSGAGQVDLTTSFIDYDVAGNPTRQGYEAQAREDGTGTSAPWRVAAYAICAS